MICTITGDRVTPDGILVPKKGRGIFGAQAPSCMKANTTQIKEPNVTHWPYDSFYLARGDEDSWLHAAATGRAWAAMWHGKCGLPQWHCDRGMQRLAVVKNLFVTISRYDAVFGIPFYAILLQTGITMRKLFLNNLGCHRRPRMWGSYMEANTWAEGQRTDL